MRLISLNDYKKTVIDNGKEIYALSPCTVQKLGKKKTAGIPKTVTVHIPTAKEARGSLDEAFAEIAAKAIARALGI